MPRAGAARASSPVTTAKGQGWRGELPGRAVRRKVGVWLSPAACRSWWAWGQELLRGPNNRPLHARKGRRGCSTCSVTVRAQLLAAVWPRHQDDGAVADGGGGEGGGRLRLQQAAREVAAAQLGA